MRGAGAVVSSFVGGRHSRKKEAYKGSLFGENGAEHLQDLTLGELCAEWIWSPGGLRER